MLNVLDVFQLHNHVNWKAISLNDYFLDSCWCQLLNKLISTFQIVCCTEAKSLYLLIWEKLPFAFCVKGFQVPENCSVCMWKLSFLHKVWYRFFWHCHKNHALELIFLFYMYLWLTYFAASFVLGYQVIYCTKLFIFSWALFQLSVEGQVYMYGVEIR